MIMTKREQEIIHEIVSELIEKMGFSAEISVEVKEGPAESFFCAVSVSEGQNFLIGQYGMNLAALQHLVRILARKKLGEKFDIVIDINNYFSEKKQLVEKEAAQALEEALQNNISVALRPMLPYERKIVHSFLATNESVATESIGKGDERKVIIRPRPVA